MADTKEIESFLSRIENNLDNIEVHLETIASKQDETNELLSGILAYISHSRLKVSNGDVYSALRDIQRDIHRIARNQFE
ncbi:hypothetical protein C6502_01285 [Candidatus Poribacteria bacterium]|nr:MAG: hypothetical protein C6502_01285 [Candidatus Poribacteria bacterium]